jgi:UDP-N-acetylmuramate--alanine ligase
VDIKNLKYAYFIGIGGIGMSALARFFHSQGIFTHGYDRTATDLTLKMESEGMSIHYNDDPGYIRSLNIYPDETLVIYTPAIPSFNKELQFFRANGFDIKKRAEVLGMISKSWDAVCVAGTHGKTTISTLTAHLFTNSKIGCSAFIGGISKNYGTNYLHSAKSPYVVLEADEFDRSFLHLSPYMSVITSIDADHLDIYGDKKHLTESFKQYAMLTRPQGTLIVKKGLKDIPVPENGIKLTYSLNEECDFYASDIRLVDDRYVFTLNSDFGKMKNLTLGIPGLINVENAVAASALALSGGVSEDELRKGLKTFKGIRRRFEYVIKSEDLILIDDYAHHPAEIKATLDSLKDLNGGKKIHVIFQPHLYSRTKDFAKDFAKELDKADKVYLLDIYPARELPIEGVTSGLIQKYMKNKNVVLCDKESVFDLLTADKPDVLLTMGAGDIDRLVPLLEKRITEASAS